jgi:hypothetical protein
MKQPDTNLKEKVVQECKKYCDMEIKHFTEVCEKSPHIIITPSEVWWNTIQRLLGAQSMAAMIANSTELEIIFMEAEQKLTEECEKLNVASRP